MPYAIAGSSVVTMPIEPTVAKKIALLVQQGHVPTTLETVELMCDTMDREYGGLSRYLAGPVGFEAQDVAVLRQALLVD